ncbi:hypothetical protein CKG00_17120 (plasmid) [Morganella morganii]|uniref:Uncharacterized protein n=1 Tax=Morganella morganii TaxID=582 RepID=A0A433ZRX9_MORMO|nr:hypothetical protein CKG00_17120 [Morganella morganii]
MPERGVLWVFFQNHLRFGKQPPGSAPVLSRHYITARGSGKQQRQYCVTKKTMAALSFINLQ